MNCTADRLDPEDRLTKISSFFLPGNDDGRRAIARDVAVVEAERGGNDARTQIVVQGQGLLEDRTGIEGRMTASIQCNPAKLLLGGSILVEMSLSKHRNPLGSRHGLEGDLELEVTPDASSH